MNSQQLKVETEGGSESSILFAGSTEARKLAQFRAELSSHPTTETSAAFDLARLVSSPYVDSDAFLLQFLRAENYDPKRAKERIYSHFLKKLELFGPHRLGNPVTLFELNSEDKASLLSASTVLLPDKDSLGRSILVTRYQAMKFSKAANVVRKEKDQNV